MSKASKEPRTCIFCPEGAGSKEHFWSEWMHPLLAPYSTKSSATTRYMLKGKGRTQDGPAKTRNHVGSLYNKTLRVVCGDCNGIWMSGLETAVIPILTPMIQGNPLRLSPDDQHILARWIALKVLVSEHTFGGREWVTPLEDRVRFREDQSIPRYFRIYVAEHIDKRWKIRFTRHAVHLRNVSEAPLDAARRNVELASFGIGSVFAIAMASMEVDPDKLFAVQSSRIKRLFPASGTAFDWTAEGPILPKETDEIAYHLDRVLKHPNVIDKTK